MEALKSIIPIAIIIGILLTWSASKKYSFTIKAIVTSILLVVFCISWFVWPGKPFTGNVVSNGIITTSLSSSDNVIITISGSMVMSDELAPKLAKAYMEENDYTNVEIEEKEDVIEVTGTLKGKKESIVILPTTTKTGIRDLDDNKIDIALSLVKSENNSFEEKEIGLDAVCVVTNKEHDETDLSLAEIASIFEGTSKQHYNVYCLDASNEYREFFDKEVMQGKQVTSSAKIFKDEKELLKELSKDPNGIGIIDYEYVKAYDVRLVAVKEMENFSPIIPNDITVQNENYALSMRIYMYSLYKTKNEHVRRFINWIESDEGQDIVDKSGFINFDVNLVTKETDAEEITIKSDDPAEYKKLINTSVPISTEFRFKFGGYELDSRAEDDIDRVIKFVAKKGFSKNTITLAGFTDNIGDVNANINLSIKRADAVKEALYKQGLKNIKTVGFGQARPIRENSTEEHRSENRRVEVWISK